MATSAESIRSFASRPWTELEQLKRRHWATSSLSPADLLALADELRQYTLKLRPDWPDDAERKADLQAHIEMASQLARTGHERRH